ncbi:hypothetical protein IWZ00DRAFT_542737 [Phyllosticta capitalensis]
MASASLLPMAPSMPLDSDDSEDQYSFASFGSTEGLHPDDIESPEFGSPTSSLPACDCHNDEYCPDLFIETVELALVVRPKLIDIPPSHRPPLPPDDDSAHASGCDSDVTPAITLTENPLSDNRATSPVIANEAESKHKRKDSVTLQEALASDPPANVTITSPPASAFASPTPPKPRGFKRFFKRKNKNPSISSDPLTKIEAFPEISRPITPTEQQFPVSYSDNLEPEPITALPYRKPPQLPDKQEIPASEYIVAATANRRRGPSDPSFGSPTPAAQRHNNEARRRLADQYVDSHYRNLSATTTTPASAPSHRFKYADTIGFASRNANTGIAAIAAPGAMAAAQGTPTPTHLRRKKSLKQLVKRSGSDSLPISRPVLMANNSMTPVYYQQPGGERGRADGGGLKPSDQQSQHQHNPAPVANNTSPRDHPMNYTNNYTFPSKPTRAGVSSGSGGATAATMSPASCRSPAGSQTSSPWPSRKSSLAPPPQTASPKPQRPLVRSPGASSPSRSLHSAASGRSEKSERSMRSQGSVWDVVNPVDVLEEKVREDEERSAGDEKGEEDNQSHHYTKFRRSYDGADVSDSDEEEPPDAEKLALHAGIGSRLEKELELQQVKQGKPQVVEVDVDIAKDSSDGTTLVEGSDSFDDYSSSEYEDD